MTLEDLKQLQEAVEKHQSCLHCGKQGHHHTNCLWTFVKDMPKMSKEDLYDAVKMEMFKASSALEGVEYGRICSMSSKWSRRLGASGH